MEIIRDHTQIKTLDQTISYACMGFTRSNLFNSTHDHLVNYTIGKAQKTFAMLWDNEYDIKYYENEPVSPSLYDEPETISWFEQKGFDYLFIPEFSFIETILNTQQFQDALSFSENVIEQENYTRLLGTDYNPGNLRWIKLLLARHYYLFTNQKPDRFLNRTYQAIAPDGTWGFILKHFCEKYCGGEFPLVPLLRNDNGLVFDIIIERNYPKEIKDIFNSFVSLFHQYKEDRSLENLKINVANSLLKPKSQKYFFSSLDYYCEDITLNKYVLRLQIRNHMLRDNGRYDFWRLWEYEEGL